VKIGDAFSTISRKASSAAGSWQASTIAAAIVVIWTLGGFYFGFTSELYQLAINTFTTITTFVMVFLIQASQNRDQRSLQIKLNEIIHVLEKADDKLINIENATDEEIDDADKRVCANSDDTPD
jgi:low affinity Fe/Cu permease